jgi:uncharacterized protein YjbI with pentapeptide repeats
MIYTKEKLEQLRHRWTTTKGKKLVKIIKESRCYLSPVLYRSRVKSFPYINDHEVEDDIDLRGASLAGFDFRVPIQEDDEGFTEQVAIMSNIHFEGANLKHCNFEGGKIHSCNFEDSDLSHAEFKNSSLNDCAFQDADCTSLNLRGAKLINCNFSEASIKDIILDTTIVDQKTTFGRILKSEKDASFHFASIEYKQIKEMYKNSSLHSEADKYHYKEMVAKRKINKITNPLRWLNYFFGDLLCKYGTSFIRVLLWSALLIFTCAILLNVNNSLHYQNQPTDPSFLEALYFSIVTFTTLGYGDFHAVGLMRFVAAMEAFVGAALMSLFTVIVARNIIRD